MYRPRSHSFDDRRLHTELSPYLSDSEFEVPQIVPKFDQGSWTSSSSYYTAVVPETHAPHTTHQAPHHTGYLFPGHGAELGQYVPSEGSAFAHQYESYMKSHPDPWNIGADTHHHPHASHSQHTQNTEPAHVSPPKPFHKLTGHHGNPHASHHHAPSHHTAANNS